MKNPSQALYLRRIDPDRNMRRYYHMTIERTLFGEVSLMRSWGRIGANGQQKTDFFNDEAEAEKAKAALARAKRAKGYFDVMG